MRLLKPLFFSIAALAPLQAPAQVPPVAPLPVVGVPPALEVQRLAPQLVTFFGPGTNFQSLVNGLATGTPVTLGTVGADGLTRVVTFTPTGALPALQVAQVLESARQSLISRGIAAPTAEQTAVTLIGGNLQTATGTVQTNALVPTAATATPSAAAGASAGFSAGTTTTGVNAANPAVAVQQQATPVTPPASTTSASPFPRPISDTPPLPLPGTPGVGQGATIGTPATTAPAGGTAGFRATR